jgi:hypothetical protein
MQPQSSKSGNDLLIVASADSTASDFDFLVGEWRVQNCKLKERLNNSNEWFEFEALAECRKILNGLGNIDSFRPLPEEQSPEGMALRLFNPQTRLWSIYWADSETGTLDVPQIGSFENKIGRFYARDTFQGKDIIVQFHWDANGKTPKWSQAFSADNGETWEWNWYMTFHRIDR